MVRRNLATESAISQCERIFNALIDSFLKKYNVKRWLVSHSGGLDSQVLLHLISRYPANRPIVVVHVNHNLQEQADEWAKFSAQQAQLLGVKSEILEVQPLSRSEEGARDARYHAFHTFMLEGDCLLQGHHSDDQAETVLFRMLRGTGLKGMLGIPEVRQLSKGWVLRPLLKLNRQQLQHVAEEVGLEFVVDPSNAKDEYDRNFLRLHVMPLLKQRWPEFTQRWQMNLEQFSVAQQLLDDYLKADLEQCTPFSERLSISAWLELPPLRRREVLRFWVSSVVGVALNEKQLTHIIKDVIFAKDDAMPVFKRKGVDIRRFNGSLYLLAELRAGIEGVPLQLDGVQNLGDGMLTVNGVLSKALWAEAVVKRRKGGEVCRPIGRKGSVSVKKLLQEASVEPWNRSQWPLIFVGEKLAAIPGICLCEGFEAEKTGNSLLWRPFSLSDNS